MKITLPTLIAVVVFAGVTSTATAETMGGHTVVSPPEIKWGRRPPCSRLEQAAVLFGDPSKEGLFALRLKLPRATAFRRIPIRSMRSSR